MPGGRKWEACQCEAGRGTVDGGRGGGRRGAEGISYQSLELPMRAGSRIKGLQSGCSVVVLGRLRHAQPRSKAPRAA